MEVGKSKWIFAKIKPIVLSQYEERYLNFSIKILYNVLSYF